MNQSQTNPLFALLELWLHHNTNTPHVPEAVHKLTPLVLDSIDRFDPWEFDQAYGFAPVDLLTNPSTIVLSDWIAVMEACLKHPSAPSPKQWSVRPSLVREKKVALPWAHALVRFAVPQVVEKYIEWGGLVGVFDHRGLSPLVRLGFAKDDVPAMMDTLFAAAQKEKVDLASNANPSGKPWSLVWREEFHLTGTQLSVYQQAVHAAQKKYPLVSNASPEEKHQKNMDEFFLFLRSLPGHRSLASTVKRLGLEKDLEKPEHVQRIFSELTGALIHHNQSKSFGWARSSLLLPIMSTLRWSTSLLKHIGQDENGFLEHQKDLLRLCVLLQEGSDQSRKGEWRDFYKETLAPLQKKIAPSISHYFDLAKSDDFAFSSLGDSDFTLPEMSRMFFKKTWENLRKKLDEKSVSNLEKDVFWDQFAQYVKTDRRPFLMRDASSLQDLFSALKTHPISTPDHAGAVVLALGYWCAFQANPVQPYLLRRESFFGTTAVQLQKLFETQGAVPVSVVSNEGPWHEIRKALDAVVQDPSLLDPQAVETIHAITNALSVPSPAPDLVPVYNLGRCLNAFLSQQVLLANTNTTPPSVSARPGRKM